MPPSPSDRNDWMSVSEVARYLEISADAVRQRADRGVIPYQVIGGGQRIFKRTDVEKFKRKSATD